MSPSEVVLGDANHDLRATGCNADADDDDRSGHIVLLSFQGKLKSASRYLRLRPNCLVGRCQYCHVPSSEQLSIPIVISIRCRLHMH
jgi:hypothetical protein